MKLHPCFLFLLVVGGLALERRLKSTVHNSLSSLSLSESTKRAFDNKPAKFTSDAKSVWPDECFTDCKQYKDGSDGPDPDEEPEWPPTHVWRVKTPAPSADKMCKTVIEREAETVPKESPDGSFFELNAYEIGVVDRVEDESKPCDDKPRGEHWGWVTADVKKALQTDTIYEVTKHQMGRCAPVNLIYGTYESERQSSDCDVALMDRHVCYIQKADKSTFKQCTTMVIEDSTSATEIKFTGGKTCVLTPAVGLLVYDFEVKEDGKTLLGNCHVGSPIKSIL